MTTWDGKEIRKMAHEERLPQCESFQCEIKDKVDEHIRDSGPIRDSVKDHERRLMSLEEYVKKQGDLKLTIIGSSVSVIVVILLACITWAVAWGGLIEKTNRLEKLHPYGVAIAPDAK